MSVRTTQHGLLTRLITLALLSLLGCDSAEKTSKPDDAGLDAQVDTTDGGPEPVVPDDEFLRDAQGRALILRGVNATHTAKRSVDGLPWLAKDDVLRLRRDFGMNVIRLTLFWRWVEPARGMYDRAYLGRIRTILDWAKEADIHVLVDMHQDLFGFEATDSAEGDGPPEWARDPACPAFEDRMPWFFNYFSMAVECQFTSFYANKNGVLDAFEGMWRVVSEELGDHEAVIGFDLFNEPWIPNGLSPETALVPFYEKLIPAVREESPTVPIFYEPGTLSGSVDDQSIPKPNFDRLVYAPHFYPSSVFGANSSYSGDVKVIDELLTRHTRIGKRDKVPVWIGEFGTDDEMPGASQYMTDVLKRFGTQFIGFARWAYDARSEYDLAILDNLVDKKELPSLTVMIEPYAERIPGKPKTTSANMTERRLVIEVDAPDGGELVLSCPSRFCANGSALKTTIDDKAVAHQYDATNGQVRVTLPTATNAPVTLRW